MPDPLPLEPASRRRGVGRLRGLHDRAAAAGRGCGVSGLGGDSGKAAIALKDCPRWVALHENTLAKLDVVLAIARADGLIADDDLDWLLRDLDEARRNAERAHGVDMDAAPEADA